MPTKICDEKDALLSYVYGECDAQEREKVEAHLETCAVCRQELEDLGAVRGHLATWTPPERVLGFRIVQDEPGRPSRRWFGVSPAWGLAAAAVLLLAVAAAVANLEVRYDRQGLLVRTGWGRPAPEAPTPVLAAEPTPWRADLERFQQQLRDEFRSVPLPPALAAPAGAATRAASADRDRELLQRVRAIVAESEKRQQQELALHVAQLVQDFDRQRQTDWVRIEQNFGRLEGMTGAEVAHQRELLNYLMRVSQRR